MANSNTGICISGPKCTEMEEKPCDHRGRRGHVIRCRAARAALLSANASVNSAQPVPVPVITQNRGSSTSFRSHRATTRVQQSQSHYSCTSCKRAVTEPLL
eukprot:3938226-Rhodomonas_salina.1